MDTQPTPTDQQLDDILEEITKGNKKVALFLTTWLQNGLNGTKSYMLLHPSVSPESAAVMSSRMLRTVKVSELLELSGLGLESYLTQLKTGLHSLRWNADTKKYEEDNRTRRSYHQVLGQLLGIEANQSERDKPTTPHLEYVPASWFIPPKQIEEEKGVNNEPNTFSTTS